MIQYAYLDLVPFSNASNILLTDVTTYVFDIGQPSFNGKTNPTSLSVILSYSILPVILVASSLNQTYEG